MPDEFDFAQAREQAARDEALDRARQAAAALQDRGEGQKDCDDCGDRIPAARRRVVPGAARCVACQTLRERGLSGAA